jgi:hypothetical protein
MVPVWQPFHSKRSYTQTSTSQLARHVNHSSMVIVLVGVIITCMETSSGPTGTQSTSVRPPSVVSVTVPAASVAASVGVGNGTICSSRHKATREGRDQPLEV